MSEFKSRDSSLREMQSTMSRLRTQMSAQSNNWRQFSARQKMGGNGGVKKLKGGAGLGLGENSHSPSHHQNGHGHGHGHGHHQPTPPDEARRRQSVVARHESYDFDPNLPRVANITKKQPGELNDVDLHRMEAANAVVRYAESRSAVYEPSKNSEAFGRGEPRTDLSSTTLTLEHVYGYSGKVATDTNVLHLHGGELVYPASATVVIHDVVRNSQRFFLEHDDDVMSLAVHPKVDIVASGQLCRRAFVLVYAVGPVGEEAATAGGGGGKEQKNSGGITFISELVLGPNTCGCMSLDFSPDGDMLLCVAADPYHTVSIWDWKKAHMLTSARASNAEVFSMRFNPFQCYSTDMVSAADSEFTLVTVGARHVKFWTLVPDDSIVTGADGALKNAKEVS